MNIRKKLALFVFLIFFTGILNVTLTSIVTNIQKQDGLLINLAGRQRMLSQKISKDVFLITCADEITTTDKTKIKADLKTSTNLFQETILGFSKGGTITTPEGKKQTIQSLAIDAKYMTAANQIWDPFYKALESYITNEDETSMVYIRDHNVELLASANDITVAIQAGSDQKIQMQMEMQFILALISLVVFAVVMVIIQRDIIKPIYRLVGGTKLIADGDLTGRLDGEFKGEYKTLVHNFNMMSSNLKTSISETISICNDLYTKSDQLAEDSVIISQGSREISLAIESIANGSQEQAEEVAKTVTITKDLSKSLDEMSGFVNTTRQSVEIMDKNTEKTQSTIHKLEKVFETNELEYRKIDEDISKLSEKSNVIGTILETISNIAEQTNLLSLNASIEAARAGEHGKGFAIVAAEVKKLADESQRSTEQIQEIIQNIVDVIQSSATSISAMNQSMAEIKKVMAETKESLELIEDNLVTVNENSTIEEKTIIEINRMKERVVGSIDTIMSAIERSSAATEEINATTMQEDVSIQNLTTTIETFHAVARQLETINEKFRI